MASDQKTSEQVIDYKGKRARLVPAPKTAPVEALKKHHEGPTNVTVFEADKKKRSGIFSRRKHTMFKQGDCLTKVCGATVLCCIKSAEGNVTELFDPSKKAECILKSIVDKRKMKEQKENHKEKPGTSSSSSPKRPCLSAAGGPEPVRSPTRFAAASSPQKQDTATQCQLLGGELHRIADHDKFCRICGGGDSPNHGRWIGCDFKNNTVLCNHWVHERCLGFSGMTNSMLSKLGWLCPSHRN